MDKGANYLKLEEHICQVSGLEHAQAMLSWDDAVVMPTGGGEARAEALATLGGRIHEFWSSNFLNELIVAAQNGSLDEWQLANLRIIKEKSERARAIPDDLATAAERATTRCEQRWRRLRAKNDWQGIENSLEEVFNLIRQKAECLSEAFDLSPYDALLNDYERGNHQDLIDPLFDELLEFLGDFVDEVLANQEPTDEVITSVSDELQMRLARVLMTDIGFDLTHGRIDTSHHPFTGGIPDDTRITTRINNSDFMESMFAVLHETGHALYEQGLPKRWRNQPVGRSAGMMVHESQSLFWEMQICRSPEYLRYANPILSNVAGVSIDNATLGKKVHRVQKGLIRVYADEVTYPLHVALRYEIEKALISGKMRVSDIPDVWNERMSAMLGLSTVGDYENGCMQDVHWFSGAIGYFPSYTLGALMAAQLFATCREHVPEILNVVEQGIFEPAIEWLRENIHRQGNRQLGHELIRSVTGKSLGVDAFRSHLIARYRH